METGNIFCISGASGFVGRHLVDRILGAGLGSVHALSRSVSLSQDSLPIRWFQGDLGAESCPTEWLVKNGILIHLAYTGENETQVIERLFHQAHQKGIKRILFCSTAMVVGRSHQAMISEATEASPQSQYEKEKSRVEKAILSHAWKMPISILRPTAVFGPGGKNLLFAMPDFYADNLKSKFRRILFGRRKMHLLSVHNLVSAILHLAFLDESHLEKIYQVTDDESPLSRFDHFYREFLEFQGKPLRSTFSLPVFPAWLLSLFLRWGGRSLINPKTTFNQQRLRKSGFKPSVELKEAYREFFEWYQSHMNH